MRKEPFFSFPSCLRGSLSDKQTRAFVIVHFVIGGYPLFRKLGGSACACGVIGRVKLWVSGLGDLRGGGWPMTERVASRPDLVGPG
jgi:hypothetical protein